MKYSESLKYTLGYLAIAFTGIHFFSAGAVAKALFVVVILYFIGLKAFESRYFYIPLLLVLLLILVQHIIFSHTTLYDIIAGIILLLLIPYGLFHFFKLDFPLYYVKTLYFICLVSLPFYITSLIIPGFFHSISQIPVRYPFLDPVEHYDYQFILFSTNPNFDPFLGILRNSGAFHEPGVFGLFLVIGIYFNYIVHKTLFNKPGIVFLICTLTTLSTATFLGLSILFFGIILKSNYSTVLKILFVPVIFILTLMFIMTNPLMLSKIQHEYKIAMNRKLNEDAGGRFYGARRAIYVIKKYPITGRGFLPSTREKNPRSFEFVRYGILYEISKMGLILSFFFYLYLWKGVKTISENFENSELALYFFLALLINLLSQSFSLSVLLIIIVYFGIWSENFTNTVKNE